LNITEGATSGYDAELKRFLQLAIRSANEVATGFEIAKRLAYSSEEQALKQIQECDEIASMLQGLSKSLNRVSEDQEQYIFSESEEM
jgi:four helix bundle protein